MVGRRTATDVDRSDSPVSDFLRTRSAVILDFERTQNVRKLKALMNELRLIATLFRTDNKKVDSKGRIWCPMTNYAAIDHYLATQYIASDLLSDQASRLRAVLALSANKRLKKSAYELAGNWTGTVRENVRRLLGAYEAGNSLDSIELESFAQLSEAPDAPDDAAKT
jgi:hypothetical protein